MSDNAGNPHRIAFGHERCRQCGVAKAIRTLAKPRSMKIHGCARGKEPEHAGLCASMRIELLQMALRRALRPDAFDTRGRIREGYLLDVLEAERDAIRRAAPTRGPMAVPDVIPTEEDIT